MHYVHRFIRRQLLQRFESPRQAQGFRRSLRSFRRTAQIPLYGNPQTPQCPQVCSAHKSQTHNGCIWFFHARPSCLILRSRFFPRFCKVRSAPTATCGTPLTAWLIRRSTLALLLVSVYFPASWTRWWVESLHWIQITLCPKRFTGNFAFRHSLDLGQCRSS